MEDIKTPKAHFITIEESLVVVPVGESGSEENKEIKK